MTETLAYDVLRGHADPVPAFWFWAVAIGLLTGAALLALLIFVVIPARNRPNRRQTLIGCSALALALVAWIVARERTPYADAAAVNQQAWTVKAGVVSDLDQDHRIVSVDSTRFATPCDYTDGSCPALSVGDRVRIAYRGSGHPPDVRVLRIWKLPPPPPSPIAPPPPAPKPPGMLVVRPIPGRIGQ